MQYPVGQCIAPVRPCTRPRLGHVRKPPVTRVGKAGLHIETGGVGVAVWVEAQHQQRSIAEVLEQQHESLVFARCVVCVMLVLIALNYEAVGAEVDECIRTAPAAAPAAAHTLVVDDGDAVVLCSDIFDNVHDALLLDLVSTRYLLIGEQVHEATRAKATIHVITNDDVTTFLLATLVLGVDHVAELVCCTVSRGTVRKTKNGSFGAPARVLATLANYVDHVVELVCCTVSRGAVRKTKCGSFGAPTWVLAPLVGVDHVVELVCCTMSRGAVRKTKCGMFGAPTWVLATLVLGVDHVVELVCCTISRGTVRKTKNGSFGAPAQVLATLANYVDHVVELVCCTISRGAVRNTKCGMFGAPIRMLATLANYVDHVVELVCCTVSRGAVRKTKYGSFGAPTWLAPLVLGVDHVGDSIVSHVMTVLYLL